MVFNLEKKVEVLRGDIFFADLSTGIGSEQGGVRPVIIIQNDVGNRYSPTVIAVVITSRSSKANLPTYIKVNEGQAGLVKDSIILCEQVRTIDKSRLRAKIGKVENILLGRINTALMCSIGLVH
jgi:mRNA interferase MazF